MGLMGKWAHILDGYSVNHWSRGWWRGALEGLVMNLSVEYSTGTKNIAMSIFKIKQSEY